MSLSKVAIENIRNLKNLTLEIDRRLTIITGENGAGKTSILEAIHLLGSGKSFRTSKVQQILMTDSHIMRVTAEVADNFNHHHHIGWQHDSQDKRISIDADQNIKTADLARILPVRCIQPDSHYRFRQDSRYRRSLLDWGVFHVEPLFQEQWQKYQRALKQRNKILKNQSVSVANIKSWDEQLSQAGELIDLYRKNYINLWKPYVSRVLANLFNEAAEDVELNYEKGWDKNNLLSQLQQEHTIDIKRGSTGSGCHRADLVVNIGGEIATSYASQGQQKLLFLSLVLSQIELFLDTENHFGVTLMLDDVPSELDEKHREQLLHYLANSRIQTIITTTDLAQFEREQHPIRYKRFHVERGEIIV